MNHIGTVLDYILLEMEKGNWVTPTLKTGWLIERISVWRAAEPSDSDRTVIWECRETLSTLLKALAERSPEGARAVVSHIRTLLSELKCYAPPERKTLTHEVDQILLEDYEDAVAAVEEHVRAQAEEERLLREGGLHDV